jgi:hypothetical protein
MSANLDNFDDEGLKQALRRAIPRVGAPEGLRLRVQAAFQEAGAAPAGPVGMKPERRGAWGWMNRQRMFAMAASFIGLVMGVGMFFALNHAEDGATVAANGQAQLGALTPNYLFDAVGWHEQVQDTPSQRDSMLAPYDQVWRNWQKQADGLQPKLDLTSFGWQLVGARKYGPAAQSAIQMVYQRNGMPLSVFLVPDQKATTEQSNSGSTVVRGHIVATRQLGNLKICVVGGSSTAAPAAAEVSRIADFVSVPAK